MLVYWVVPSVRARVKLRVRLSGKVQGLGRKMLAFTRFLFISGTIAGLITTPSIARARLTAVTVAFRAGDRVNFVVRGKLMVLLGRVRGGGVAVLGPSSR